MLKHKFDFEGVLSTQKHNLQVKTCRTTKCFPPSVLTHESAYKNMGQFQVLFSVPTQ